MSTSSPGATRERPALALEVRQEIDVFMVRTTVRELAEGLGFERPDAEELALVATKIGLHLLQHSGRGKLVVELLRDPARGPGVRVVATDRGPALQGLSAPLAAARRLMHTLEHRVEGESNVIVAMRWLCGKPGTPAR